MRLLLFQESSQHKNYMLSLGWAVAIQMASPGVLDARNLPKRVLVASLLTVNTLLAGDVVTWVYRVPRAVSSIDRLDSLTRVVWRVLDVTHHWQM